MTSETSSVNSGNRGFLARITTATAFGEGLDGYDLGTIHSSGVAAVNGPVPAPASKKVDA